MATETQIPRTEFNEIEYLQKVAEEPEAKKSRSNQQDSNESGKTVDEWEKYRGSHEPEEHWELRKEFLKRNQERFTDNENRLLCLSRTFANMEFLGCKYPLDTMELVSELSMGIVEEYRAKKRNRIQRTFVKASDAAEKKTKGQKGPSSKQNIDSSSKAALNPVKFKKSADNLGASASYVSPNNVALQSLMKLEGMNLNHKDDQSDVKTVMTSEEIVKAYPCAEDINVTLKKSFEAIRILSSTTVDVLDSVDKTMCTIINAQGLMKDLDGFYIMELDHNATEVTILTHSFSACHKNDFYKFDCPPYKLTDGLVCKCDLQFGGNKKNCLVIHGEGKSQKDAKKDVAVRALKFFKQLRPTIKLKEAPNRKVDRSEILPKSKHANSSTKAAGSKATNDGSASKAMKMMLAMGWKGGGLGLNEDGIASAISDPVAHNTRLGLGNVRDDSVQFEENVKELLGAERESLYDSDIEFSPSFTKGERKLIHTLAERMGFKSKSYGSDKNRHLIISRKVEPEQILREVMAAGGETPKYKVELPPYIQNS